MTLLARYKSTRPTYSNNDIAELQADSEGRLLTVSTTGASGITSIAGGTRTVTTAGTAVQLTAASTPCKSVLIQGDIDNTGTIFVGGSDVDSTTQNGNALDSSVLVAIEIDNLNKIYIDATVSGEKVGFIYFN